MRRARPYSKTYRTTEQLERKERMNRLREAAKRQGYSLSKSRRRDPHALDFDRCWLTDDQRSIEFANTAELEKWLATPPSERPNPG